MPHRDPSKTIWRVTTRRLDAEPGDPGKNLHWNEGDEAAARADFARRRPRRGWKVVLLRGIFGVDRKLYRPRKG